MTWEGLVKNPYWEHIPLQSNRFGCYSLESIVPFLEFTVTLQSNNLIPDQKYSVRQQITYSLIKHLHDIEGLGYRRISQKMNQWGIKTQRGNKWYPNSVHSVLKRRNQRDERISSQRNETFPVDIGELSLKYHLFD